MATTTIPTPTIKEALNALRVLWGLRGVDVYLLSASYGRRLDTRATVEEVAGDVWNRFIESRTPHEEL